MSEEILNQNINESPESSLLKPRMKFNLICTSKVKKYALELAKTQIRTQNHSRVSEEFLLSCEVALKNHIINRVKIQPTKGKTLT